MMFVVRRSKFKHVFGKPLKKEACYEDIRITSSGWDARFCAVNPKFLAIITEAGGGGSFLVLPIEKVGRVERDAPLVAGHKGSVLDIQWCPHNDNLIASASEDTTVKVWQIPDGGLEPDTNLTVPIADLVAHMRRTGLVVWHPTAEHVLLSAGADNMVFIWNIATEEPLVKIKVPDMILSASFNYNGSRLATTCKDRTTRILDPRTGDVITEGICHQGNKPQQVVYISGNRIFTTGFSPSSTRECAVWSDSDFAEPLARQEFDISNGSMFPFYDWDTNMVYLCGKGDSTIRYFEITDEKPYLYFINMLTSSEPQRGMGWMPKRGLDVHQCEIARFYKLHAKGLCEVIPFTVPRRSELFQEDLYPDTFGELPALTAEEWMAGIDKDPVLISMKDMYANETSKQAKPQLASRLAVSKVPTKRAGAAAPQRHHSAAQPAKPTPEPRQRLATGGAREGAGRRESTGSSEVASRGTDQANANGTAEVPHIDSQTFQAMLDDMRKMKIVIKGHEHRLKRLEKSLKPLDEDTVDTAAPN